jgi:DNA-binding response OmpR family regulator
MVSGDVPLVVCVTPDVEVRERVARRLSDCGVVLMCADIGELRAVLFPTTPADLAADGNAAVRALGDLVIDGGNHVASWRGAPLPLTRLEWELLGSLATPPPVVWTYERLFGTVWGGAYLGDTSILHSAMKRLRRKLRAVGDGVSIETVRGIGYRLALKA